MANSTDINECSPITVFPLNVECDVTDTSTPTTADGSISLIITGGTSPYTILWSNNAVSNVISNLLPGTYSATVTDYYGETATTECVVESDTFELDHFESCGGSGDIFLTGITQDLVVDSIYELSSSLSITDCENISINYSSFIEIAAPALLSSQKIFLGWRNFINGLTNDYYYDNGNIYYYVHTTDNGGGTDEFSFSPSATIIEGDLTCNDVTYPKEGDSDFYGYSNTITINNYNYILWLTPSVSTDSEFRDTGIKNVYLCCNTSNGNNCWTYKGKVLFDSQTIQTTEFVSTPYQDCLSCDPSESDVPEKICLSKLFRTSPTPTPTMTPTPSITPSVTTTPTPSITPSPASTIVSLYSCCHDVYFNVDTSDTNIVSLPDVGESAVLNYVQSTENSYYNVGTCYERVEYNPIYFTPQTDNTLISFGENTYGSCNECNNVYPCVVGASPTQTPTNTPTQTPTPSITITPTPSYVPTLPCDGTFMSEGGKGYYSLTTEIGTDTGYVYVDFDSLDMVERFQIKWDGNVVADSIFVGSGYSESSTVNNILGTTELIKYVWNGSEFVATSIESVNFTDDDIASCNTTRFDGNEGNQINVDWLYPSMTASNCDAKVRLFFTKDSAYPTEIEIIAMTTDVSSVWRVDTLSCPGTQPSPYPSQTPTATPTVTPSTDPTPVVAECSAIIIDSQKRVYGYDVQTNTLTQLPVSGIDVNVDISHSQDKLWISNSAGPIQEWDITLSPWSATFNREIDTNGGIGPGLGSTTSNTKLLGSWSGDLLEIDITGSIAVKTTLFQMISGRSVSGDILFTTTGKYIVTSKMGANRYITQYDYNGNVEVDIDITSTISNPWGIFQDNGNMYICDGTGEVYNINTQPPYNLTLVDDLGVTIYGSSQIYNCLDVEFTVGEDPHYTYSGCCDNNVFNVAPGPYFFDYESHQIGFTYHFDVSDSGSVFSGGCYSRIPYDSNAPVVNVGFTYSDSVYGNANDKYNRCDDCKTANNALCDNEVSPTPTVTPTVTPTPSTIPVNTVHRFSACTLADTATERPTTTIYCETSQGVPIGDIVIPLIVQEECDLAIMANENGLVDPERLRCAFLYHLNNGTPGEDVSLFDSNDDGLISISDMLSFLGTFGSVSYASCTDYPTYIYGDNLSPQAGETIYIAEHDTCYTYVDEVAFDSQVLTVTSLAGSYENCELCEIGEVEPVINATTEINIFFDSSGSMNDSLQPLEEMRDTILKNCLVQFYNDDEAEYDLRVNVISSSSERFLEWLSTEPVLPDTTQVINLAFQDESTPYGAGNGAFTFDINQAGSQNYTFDLSNLQTILDTTPNSYLRGVVFQVDYNAEGFKIFTQAVENGDGWYAGDNGLSNYGDRVKFVYDVNDGDTPAYYLQQVLNGLALLGYNINC